VGRRRIIVSTKQPSPAICATWLFSPSGAPAFGARAAPCDQLNQGSFSRSSGFARGSAESEFVEIDAVFG
jgi:hypothetical protein